MINGKFRFLAGFLDQSWWPDGQYLAPGDEALASDVVVLKTWGMNMIRLHQKVNPQRWCKLLLLRMLMLSASTMLCSGLALLSPLDCA
jgi:hypothetical protein